MRYRLVAAWTLSLALALAGPAAAQQAPQKVQVTGVRLGFPGGPQGSIVKAGAWAPVYVDLAANKERVISRDGVIRVEGHDSDDMENVYTIPLPQMEIGDAPTVISYARTANLSSEITVSVHLVDGRGTTVQPNSNTYTVVGPATYLYVTAGSRVPGLRRALSKPAGKGDPAKEGEEEDLNAPSRAFAFFSDVTQLPTVWFGYSAIDLLVLHTGDDKFVNDLIADQGGRKEALAEWVRRGGRLVISAGTNQQLVQQLLGKLNIISVNLTGKVQRTQLTGVVDWVKGTRQPFLGTPLKEEKGKRAPVEFTKVVVEPRKGALVLVEEPAGGDDKQAWPVVIQSAAGLGRVVLVAFDMELPPFLDWPGQADFWRKLQQEMQPGDTGQVAANAGFQGGGRFGNNWGGDHYEIGTQLQERLQSFDDVPIISFGWVALFIFLYILVVGPLDYFFLKKVVKRLELTWITFPVVVLVVSAVAYFSAYYIKGNDLRINKIDVVDVVAEPGAEGQPAESTWAAGTTWFTLFSPRIQNYNIGVEPAAGKWAPEPTKGGPPLGSSAVTWFGRPEDVWGGTTRTASPSLFRRAYEYEDRAAALKGVPIQVWSTKSFTASWDTRLGEKSLFGAELSHPLGKEDRLTGTITNHLPVALDDAVLCYRGQLYELGRLAPGPTRIDDLVRPEQAQNKLAGWFSETRTKASSIQNRDPYNNQYGKNSFKGQIDTASWLIKPLLLTDGDPTPQGQVRVRNSLLRELDQTWRLKDPKSEEVIVIGRAGTESAGQKLTAAEQVSQDAVSPSRLWLGTLPGSGKPREPLAGVLFQETYVRVFLPVEPAAKAPKGPEGGK